MPNLHGSDFTGVATQFDLTPVTSPDLILFPTTLPFSKSAGVAAIRFARANKDFQLEELDQHGKTIIGFTMHPLVSTANKVTGVAVTQMGSTGPASPFTPTQQSAFALMRDELTQFKASGAITAPAGKPVAYDDDRSWAQQIIDDVAVGLACAAAGAEGGLNPLADVGCSVATEVWLADQPQDVDPEPPPIVDLPTDEEVTTSSSSTSSDDGTDTGPSGSSGGYGGDDGDDGGESGEGGGGPLDDDKPPHDED